MRLKFPNGSYFDSIDSYYLIDMLNTSVSYYLQSGANDTTDYFNSPDADDYVPVALRGFYFNKGSFGQTRATQVISATFSLYV